MNIPQFRRSFARRWEVLGHSAVIAAHTGDTNETIKGTVTVPAGAMGANGLLRITFAGQNNNDAGTKTARVRFNGIGGTILLGLANTTSVAFNDQRIIANRNSLSSQIYWAATAPFSGGASTIPAAIAINTAAAVDVVFTCQLSDGGDTIQFDYYMVELLYKA